MRVWHDKIKITTDNGEQVEALAPVIISASRSTDIPAWYAGWFFNRLKKGYLIWHNPFNQTPVYVSFKKCKVIVFWTKNPKPILPYLHELDKQNIHYYFQFTLNDYQQDRFEPNLPSLQERIYTFKELSLLIGKERVIWRFDPIIITSQITPEVLLKRIRNIGVQLKGYTEKLVISFVDINTYRTVQTKLIQETTDFTKESIGNAEPAEKQMNIIGEGLAKLRRIWKEGGWELSIATCAEAIDLSKYGIEHNSCIDKKLIARIFQSDLELMYFLATGKLPDTKEMFPPELPQSPINLKDKGQRKACGCILSKDIGMYNTCPHHCVYCYANKSRDLVERNFHAHQSGSECTICMSNSIKIK